MADCFGVEKSGGEGKGREADEHGKSAQIRQYLAPEPYGSDD